MADIDTLMQDLECLEKAALESPRNTLVPLTRWTDAAIRAVPVLSAELRRLQTVIKTGGAMYRAERAAMGIPGGIDEGAIVAASETVSAQQARIRELEAERDRLRKLFDDAGQGEHNVLALVDHYQDAAIAAQARIRALTEALREAVACPQLECNEIPICDDADEPAPPGEECASCRLRERLRTALEGVP
jgi:hypothetical protein